MTSTPTTDLQPGLSERIAKASRRALECGALIPIDTSSRVVREHGIEFLVRVAKNLERKDRERAAGEGFTSRTNPFLPYDEDLFVADVSATHVGLLNKFNVVDHHLLIITREFAHQDEPLTDTDFDALWRCLTAMDGLGFYNGGVTAGASQPHKHLQMVPLPLFEPSVESASEVDKEATSPHVISTSAPTTHGEFRKTTTRIPSNIGGLRGATTKSRFPTEPLLSTALFEGEIGRVPAFPFEHAVAKLERRADEETMGSRLSRCFRTLMNAVGLPVGDRARPAAYNLLVTREWAMVVPRSREFCEGVSLNSLAFAGSFFVRTSSDLERLRARGLMNALAAVGRR